MSAVIPFVRMPAIRPPAAKAAAAWHDDPSAALAAHFRRVRDTRMAGLPFLNAAIDVAVAGCARVEGDWLVAVVTPWAIQLVLLPGGGRLWQDTATGVRCTLSLPVGELVFIGEESEEADAAAPTFLYCPLISPLDDIDSQDAACAIACDALATAAQPMPAVDPPPAPAAAEGGTRPSRRAFLLGRN